MRSLFASLMPPNPPLLILLPKPVTPLPILHTLLVHGFSIPMHLFGNKDLFSSLIITSPFPKITLANGTQTMAKGIVSAYPLSSLPLTYVLYFPDFIFNLIRISKLIHDLNCLNTFSHSSVILQDHSMGRTIGIGHESQGLYHLNSVPSSTVCTSTDEHLLVHRHLSQLNISKLRKMVSRFSSLSSLECELC